MPPYLLHKYYEQSFSHHGGRHGQQVLAYEYGRDAKAVY